MKNKLASNIINIKPPSNNRGQMLHCPQQTWKHSIVVGLKRSSICFLGREITFYKFYNQILVLPLSTGCWKLTGNTVAFFVQIILVFHSEHVPTTGASKGLGTLVMLPTNGKGLGINRWSHTAVDSRIWDSTIDVTVTYSSIHAGFNTWTRFGWGYT